MASPTSAGGASYLMNLFAAPPSTTNGVKNDSDENSHCIDPIGQDDTNANGSELPPQMPDSALGEATPLLFADRSSPLSSLLEDQEEVVGRRPTLVRSNAPSIRVMPVHEVPTFHHHNDPTTRQSVAPQKNVQSRLKDSLAAIQAECTSSSTYIGSFMNLLFQVVFALTIGATITRPHGASSMLGLFAKMASMGMIFGAPSFWMGLPDIPALYPTVDLFTAPFLANIATIVDRELFHDSNISDADNDDYFLATFTFLCSLSMIISGLLLVLASVFKLANLGSFLPFPVLCGFFAAVGVLTWTLAFKIDSNGATIGKVLFSGDLQLMITSMIHHLPSILIAVAMKLLGPKNPFFVLSLVLATIGLFHVYMLTFGISLKEMTEDKWFFSSSDLVYAPMHQSVRSAMSGSSSSFSK